jgi:DNA modification methylase
MTELVWDGKYDKDGRRVAPVRIPLPFQTVETVNESGVQRANQMDLWAQGQPLEWRNRLIWGDKKYVLPSLLPEFAGKVDLIYIDPPFATGSDFSFTTTIPESDEDFTKEPNMVEQKAYRDTWGRGLDSYLQWFYETLILLRDLLADGGAIFTHCDWRVNSAIRIVIDEVFGAENIVNEVIWCYTRFARPVPFFPRVHDTIWFYQKGSGRTFNSDEIRIPYSDETLGRTSRGAGEQGLVGSADDREARHQNRLHIGGKVPEDWWTIPRIQGNGLEKVAYPTQKPEALLERIIKACSNEGDLVLDCFCGSGTTAAVAEKLGRRWITCDLGRFAIHTTRKRLLSITGVKPFMVQNLGKYERQQWQAAEFAHGDITQSPAAQLAYRRFMLDLYRAQPIEGYSWLHGVRDGRLVHIGSVDAPISVGDVRAIVKEFWKGSGSASSNGVDILGWDFAFELNETAKQMAAENNVNLRFKTIPREVLEKRAVEQGDITFFELGALSVTVSQCASEMASAEERPNGCYATITLSDFLAPYQDVPQEIVAKISHWSQWIDYWAVDWDYQGDAFHNMAQTYRTRKDPQLQRSLSHTYEQPGTYTAVIKVIDILGNDTTKTVNVHVG